MPANLAGQLIQRHERMAQLQRPNAQRQRMHITEVDAKHIGQPEPRDCCSRLHEHMHLKASCMHIQSQARHRTGYRILPSGHRTSRTGSASLRWPGRGISVKLQRIAATSSFSKYTLRSRLLAQTRCVYHVSRMQLVARTPELCTCMTPHLVRVLKDSREASSRERSAESPSSWSSKNDRLGTDAPGTCTQEFTF
jgi:hypothetical protein